MQLRVGRRQPGVGDQRAWRGVVEQQHDVGEQAMPAREVDHASPAKEPPGPPRHLPGLVEFLPRQASGVADRARDAVEQAVTGESSQVAIGEAALGRVRKCHLFNPGLFA